MPEFTSTGTVYVDNFFAHHGIKGQKWGIRRWQNEDGSLNDAGRKRYEKLLNKYSKKNEYYSKGSGTPSQILRDRHHLRFAKNTAAMVIGAERTTKSANQIMDWNKLSSKELKNISDREINMETAKMALGTLTTLAGVVMESRRNKERKFLIKYADAYGGTPAKEVAKQLRAEKASEFRLIVASSVLSAGKTIAKSFAHSGILGQRWGLRRFQNPDGTLTEAGKARYNYKKQKLKYRAAEKQAKREQELELAKVQARSQNQNQNQGMNAVYNKTSKISKFLKDITAITVSAALLSGKAKGLFTKITEKVGDKLVSDINSNAFKRLH